MKKQQVNAIVNGTYTQSGRTSCVLACHTNGRVLEPRLQQQVLRFVSRINTVQYVELRGYCWHQSLQVKPSRDQPVSQTIRHF